MERIAGSEFEYSVATLPPTPRQRRLAFLVVILTLAAFAAAAPFAGVPLRRLDGFIPAIAAIIFVTDLVTAVLLFGQFSAIRSRALLVLACGYLLSSLIVIPYALTFPGAFAPTGLLGAGPQSAPWLHVSIRIGFAMATLGYALLPSGTHKDSIETSSRPAILWSVATIVVVVSTLTWAVTLGHHLLPSLILDGKVLPLGHYATGMVALLYMLALSILWFRRKSILDLWVMVAICALIAEMMSIALFATGRFDVAFYTNRTVPLLVSKVVLIALLSETVVLHRRLINAFLLQRRERDNRLLSLNAATAAIAHEISQPLTALSLNSASALQALKGAPPDLAGAQASLSEVRRDSDRANEIVASVRGLFKSTAQNKSMIEMNSIVRQVLKMVENDLRVYGVSVSTELHFGLPQIMADRIQLQQVILNLVRNAIEAMIAVGAPVKILRLVTALEANSVVSFTVQDSGPGIPPESEPQVFDPFFTTKSSGTGLGLSISRKIVEDHGGYLRLIKTGSTGSTFKIALPSIASSESRDLGGISLVLE